MSDQPIAETSLCNNTQHSRLQATDIHAPGGIQTHNPSMRAAPNPCLRPHIQWDQLYSSAYCFKWSKWM